jgi:hypothetical protein
MNIVIFIRAASKEDPVADLRCVEEVAFALFG